MDTYHAGKLDVAVIGAGHAGIEAALASARLGCLTAVFTINLDAVGNCPCNPSIGGTAKGHLVREIDALGGEMGRTTDACFIQSRMLNRGKGPAVHSLRAQIDRREYGKIMKHKLELQPNLLLKQGEVTALERAENGNWLLTTRLGAVYETKAVVVATGTYLTGRVFVGEISYDSGPDGMFPASFLADSLRKLGIRLRRFKTGTPARVLRSSIDFSGLEVQHGDDPVVPFSYDTLTPGVNRADCYVSWTNEKTKEIILKNLNRSQLFTGGITGVGPRYCPSIETKVVRFADKKRHQLFIEPCGLDTEEMYLQGMSTSLPEEVQVEFYRTIAGLEHVEIMRPAYAIEYDCADPRQMDATLEFKDCPGLYGAGQFNGSSGYEEAAAQGFVAGVNAALKILGWGPAGSRGPMILDRAGSYIGTLVDDLITKGTEEPYRMMTSRSEYRLVLRQDNADERLTPIGRRLGLISDERWERFLEKEDRKKRELQRVGRTVLPPSQELNRLLVSHETSPVNTGVKLAELIRRPQLDYKILAPLDPGRPDYPDSVFENAEIEIKYEGYIARQKAQIGEMRRLESRLLPKDADYAKIVGLRKEAQEKLQAVRPASVGQAARISGVSPADISVLLIWMTQREGKKSSVSNRERAQGEQKDPTFKRADILVAGGEKGILMPRMSDAASLFREYAARYGIEVSPEQEEKFRIYARLLVEWNEKINLTAIVDPEGIAAKHFLDSALVLKAFPPARGGAALDVGTGAGFPGVPLKILRPDLRLTLLDALNKRLVFLDALLAELGLSAELVHARAEEAARQKPYRGKFGFVTARAVAAMPVLCEYCLPFLKPEGVFAAMKGRVSPEEDAGARKAVSVLGCRVEDVKEYALPAGDARSIYLIRRVGPVPGAYPRHGSKIAKEPL